MKPPICTSLAYCMSIYVLTPYSQSNNPRGFFSVWTGGYGGLPIEAMIKMSVMIQETGSYWTYHRFTQWPPAYANWGGCLGAYASASAVGSCGWPFYHLKIIKQKMATCIRNSAYATKTYIASASASAHLCVDCEFFRSTACGCFGHKKTNDARLS